MILTFQDISFLRKTIHPFIPPFFLIFPLTPRFETVGLWGQGPWDIKTTRSKGENQQQTQPSYSVTCGGIRTRDLLIAAASHISFHQRFPLEKKKNFSFTCDLFYLLLSQYFLFSTSSPCKQTNQNLRIRLIFFCPLSCAVHNSTWDGSAHQLEH